MCPQDAKNGISSHQLSLEKNHPLLIAMIQLLEENDVSLDTVDYSKQGRRCERADEFILNECTLKVQVRVKIGIKK